MPWMLMICGACSHQADIDLFCRTAISGELPKNTYQCPACGHAIERRFGPARLHPSGWVEPGTVQLVPVEGRL